MGIPIATWLAYLAIAERLIRLWNSFKRATGRKKKRDEKSNSSNVPERNTPDRGVRRDTD